tara:strand:+ start:1062 stop:1283 length:222 start_codon:yes stop_codon:yes gene_type:complete
VIEIYDDIYNKVNDDVIAETQENTFRMALRAEIRLMDELIDKLHLPPGPKREIAENYLMTRKEDKQRELKSLD